jgi:hypothetical protein
MYLNDFSVRVLEGREQPGGYVEMAHGQRYRLQLRNNRSVRCDARVEIDGQPVGTWRIDAHSTITLERPAQDDGYFTFYELGTPEAKSAQIADDANTGLIAVTFTPEMVCAIAWQWTGVTPREYPAPKVTFDDSHTAGRITLGGGTVMSNTQSACNLSSVQCSYTAGGTGLEGHSGQTFGRAGAITYDYSQQTVIHLRLVGGGKAEGPRPLTQRSTPIPPRI